jgi:hypothetical protein
VEYRARDARQLGLEEVVDRVWAATWKAGAGSGLTAEVQKSIQLMALRRVMSLAADEQASGQVRAVALAKVGELKSWLSAQPRSAHVAFALAQITSFEKDPKEMRLPKAAEAPPGMPIGMACDWQ